MERFRGGLGPLYGWFRICLGICYLFVFHRHLVITLRIFRYIGQNRRKNVIPKYVRSHQSKSSKEYALGNETTIEHFILWWDLTAWDDQVGNRKGVTGRGKLCVHSNPSATAPHPQDRRHHPMGMCETEKLVGDRISWCLHGHFSKGKDRKVGKDFRAAEDVRGEFVSCPSSPPHPATQITSLIPVNLFSEARLLS